MSRGSAVPAVHSADHEILEKLQKSLPVAILHEATGEMTAGESATANKIDRGGAGSTSTQKRAGLHVRILSRTRAHTHKRAFFIGIMSQRIQCLEYIYNPQKGSRSTGQSIVQKMQLCQTIDLLIKC